MFSGEEDMKQKGVTTLQVAVVTIIIVVIVLGGIYFYMSQQHGTKAEKTIKIGFIAPLTGPLSYGGKDMKQGALLAVEEINNQGGINIKGAHYKIELVIRDDEGKPATGTDVVQELLTQENVYAIVGSYSSSVTLAVQPLIMKASKLLIVPVAVADKITDAGYPYTFRVCANQKMQTVQNAEWIYNNVNPKTFAMLLENTDYGRGGGKIWSEYMENQGVKKVAEEYFNIGTTDFSSQLSKIKNTNPDVVFVVASTNDAANIMTQAREIGLHKQFVMLGGVAQDEFLRLAGESALGLVHNSYFEPTSKRPEAVHFVNAFKEKWGRYPAMFAAGTYDAIYTLKRALESAGTLNVDAVANAIRNLSFDGAQGRIYFDNHGQAQTKVLIVQVQHVEDGINGLGRVILYPLSDKQGSYIPISKFSA